MWTISVNVSWNPSIVACRIFACVVLNTVSRTDDLRTHNIQHQLHNFLDIDHPTPANMIFEVFLPQDTAVYPFITADRSTTMTFSRLDRGSILTYIPRAVSSSECRALWNLLRPGSDSAIRWEQRSMQTPKGTSVPLPRLTALMSTLDTGTTYAYSGTQNVAQPMPPLLADMIRRLGGDFNTVFANFYKDGATSHIGWHSDAEPILDMTSGVASLTLMRPPVVSGARSEDSRTFQVLSKHENLRVGRTKRARIDKIRAGKLVEHKLGDGDFIFMEGDAFQKNWVHRVPKEVRCKTPRISLTFRRLKPE